MTRRIALIAPALLLVSAAPEPSIDTGRDATALLLSGDTNALEPKLSPQFLAALGGKAGLATFTAAIKNQAGRETELLEEHLFREGDATSYYRRSRFERLADVTTLWVFGTDGSIVAAAVRPSQPAAPTDKLTYRTKTALRLPFASPAQGRWYVRWGGRDLIHNYHAASKDQRFAYDLVVMQRDRPFRADGKANEDHYCFGQPILSPAAGKVVAAVDGLPDNVPGTMDEANPGGNHVVIEHGNAEYSFLAHLQKGSVRAKVGDAIASGAEIGRCGNSGRTTMPHLHYHLQTTPVLFGGEGLPASFNAYRANGRAVPRGEPARGEFLDP